MRVVLLGATGLIGRAVADRFAAEGCEVTAILRDPSRAPASVTRPVRGDLAGPEDWLDCLDGAEVLIHCACDWRGDMAETEPRLIDALLGRGFAGRILYTGGVWCFGASADCITEETPLAAPAAFDWDVLGWQRLMAAGSDALWLHPGLVWREDTPHHGPIAEALGAGRPVPVLAPGTQLQPLVHAEDLADGYLRACLRGPAGRSYLFVGEATPLAEIAGAWAKAHDLPVIDLPAEPDDPYGWSQRVDSGRALAELDWRPHYIDAVGTLSNGVAH